MCFSPAASFTASALLGVTGIAAVMKTKDKKALPLAMIPIFFAIQQAIEGGLWLSLRGDGTHTLLLTSLYLFFALFWWPAYGPITIYMVEIVPWRRRVLAILSCVGILVGGYVYTTYLIQPIPATIVNHCIYYDHVTPYAMVAAVLYLIATLGAGIISSKYILKFLYTLLAVFAFIAWKIYLNNFASVWCFFAAIASTIIYFVVTRPLPKKKGTKK